MGWCHVMQLRTQCELWVEKLALQMITEEYVLYGTISAEWRSEQGFTRQQRETKVREIKATTDGLCQGFIAAYSVHLIVAQCRPVARCRYACPEPRPRQLYTALRFRHIWIAALFSRYQLVLAL